MRLKIRRIDKIKILKTRSLGRVDSASTDTMVLVLVIGDILVPYKCASH